MNFALPHQYPLNSLISPSPKITSILLLIDKTNCIRNSCYLDTAAVYGNEQDIGKALEILLPKYNLKRQDIFLTTKLGKYKLSFYPFIFNTLI